MSQTIEEFLKALAESKPKKSDSNPRVKQFNMILYTNDTAYDVNMVLDKIKNDKHVATYAYILHDNDFYEDDTFTQEGNLLGKCGTKKQNHYHVCVSMNNRVPISDISLWLSVPQRFIQKTKDFAGSVLYLTHRNAPSKYQYPISSVVTNIQEYHEYLYNNYQPKRDVIPLLFGYLKTANSPTLTGFLEYYGVDHAWEVRKEWPIIRDIINEHRNGMAKLKEQYEEDFDKHRLYMNSLNMLLDKFGTVKVKQADGTYKQLTMNDDGTIDIMGYTVGGNK